MRTFSEHCSLRIDGTSRIGSAALLVLLSLVVTHAAGAARAFKWDDLKKQGLILGGTVLPPESGSSDQLLKIGNSTSNPTTVTILSIENPVVGTRYQLDGRVRYENVSGTGYLEMWSYFPSGAQYFSRTLAEEGPMMRLRGTASWRPFILPFDATGAPRPTRLVVNVVLPGRGIVYLGPMELNDLGATASGRLGTLGRVTGVTGGIAGAVIGCLGALIGVLTSLGKARRFVIASATTLIVLGVLAFAASVVAFAALGSYSDTYPVLLLFGFLSTVVPLAVLPMIRRRYEEIELRTMRAHDLGQR